MANKTTKLVITIDIDQASAKAKALTAELQRMGSSGEASGIQVKRGTDQITQGMTDAGNASTTAAVKFQTATQGMLNLSTTAIQTFTSISNLNRAENRAAAAKVGQQRAQDALNRFQIKYNKLLETGTGTTRSLTQAQNELNTAMDDYAVKADKAKIEQEAVLDIQLLFFANIMNVGVSSLQIMGAMLNDNQKAWIKNTLATKFNTLAKINNATVLGSTALAKSFDTAITNVQNNAIGRGTIAVKLHTVALHGLKIALGPIGLIFIGISVAMAAYETNTLGLKDSLNGLLGIQDDVNSSIFDGTHEADSFAKSLEGVGEVAGHRLPTSFRKLQEELKATTDSLRVSGAAADANLMRTNDAIARQKDLQRIVTSNNMLAVNGTGFSAAGKTSQSRKSKGNFFGFSLFPSLPSAGATLASSPSGSPFQGTSGSISLGSGIPVFSNPTNKIENYINENSRVTTVEQYMKSVDNEKVASQIQVHAKRLGINLTAVRNEPKTKRDEIYANLVILATEFPSYVSDEVILRRYNELVNEEGLRLDKDFRPKNFLYFEGIENLIGYKALDFTNKEFTSLSFLSGITDRKGVEFTKEQKIPGLISSLIRSGQEHLIDLIPQKYKNFILKGVPQNNLLTAKVRRGNAYSQGGRIDSFNLSGLKLNGEASVGQLTRLLSLKGLEALSDQRSANGAKMFLAYLGISPSLSPNGTANIKISANVNATLKRIEDSGSIPRAQIFISTGVDIGAIADRINPEDALRIGQLEANLRNGAFEMSLPSLLEKGLLNQSGFQYSGTTLVGVKTGTDRNGQQFFVSGRMMTVDIDGRKITLPMGQETYHLMLQNAKVTNNKIQEALGISQTDATSSIFRSNRIGFGKGQFGNRKFFGIGGINTGIGGFEGLSATLAYQVPHGSIKVDPIFEQMRKAKDRLMNSGGFFAQQALSFVLAGGSKASGHFAMLSRTASGSKLVEKTTRALFATQYTRSVVNEQFGGFYGLAQLFLDAGFSEEEAKRVQTGIDRIQTGTTIHGVTSLQSMVLDDVEKLMGTIGLDTDFHQTKTVIDNNAYRWSRGFKVKVKNSFRQVGPTAEDLLRRDLGLTDQTIRIPALNSQFLHTVAMFAQNRFSDFDDTEIANTAFRSLNTTQGLSKQAIWDIRFNTSRGDRELKNRIRYEQLHTESSGTSALI